MTREPTPRRGALLGAYLAGDLLSLLGNTVAAIVLPLLVLAETGSTAATGLVLAAQTLPAVAAGLVGGAVVDRFDRRRVSITADVLSGASIAALPVVDAVTGLSVPWFVALGVVGAFGDLPGMTAREALAPAVATGAGITVERLTGIREAAGAAVLVTGPALAGALLWLAPGAAALWVTAATSAAAAAATAALPRSTGTYLRAGGPPPATLRAAARWSLRGFRAIAADPVLGPLVALSTTGAAVIGTLQVLVLPLHFTTAGRPELLGSVLAALAAGLLAGAGAYAALADRLAPATWFRGGLTALAAGLLLLAALPALPLLLAGAALTGLGTAPVNAVATGVLVGRIDEDALGRVLGAQNTLAVVALPLVLVPAAVAMEWTAARAVGMILAVTVAAASLLTVRRVPLPRRPPADGPATAAPTPR